MFTVLIPLYNKEKYILNTINSVLNQTFKDFEILIINDGSTDNSLSIVQTIEDDRIRIINKKNEGVSSARNVGIQNAFYDWICFLDADDSMLPDCLMEMSELINDYPDANILVVNSKFSNKNTNLGPEFRGYINDYFLYTNKYGYFINSSSVTINKQAFNKIGLFNTKLSYGEDLGMWIRLSKQNKIVYTPALLSIYTQHENIKHDKSKFDFRRHISYIYDYRIYSKNEKMYHKIILIDTIYRCIFSFDIKNLNIIKEKYGIITILYLILESFPSKLVKKIFTKN